jgi:hypothetical protein
MRDAALTDEEADRLRDFERFECGEIPSGLEMKRSPRIEQWLLRPHRIGKLYVLRAEGLAFGHPDPHYSDGDKIRTSPLLWVDRRLRFVRSTKRLYALGEHAGDEIPLDGVDL